MIRAKDFAEKEELSVVQSRRRRLCSDETVTYSKYKIFYQRFLFILALKNTHMVMKLLTKCYVFLFKKGLKQIWWLANLTVLVRLSDSKKKTHER